MLAAALDTIYRHHVPYNLVVRDSTMVFQAPSGDDGRWWVQHILRFWVS
ncbi:MAG: hypothetical protein M3081_23050 [Gemmatimonadota bacterium]|nr:hypothetical protein [Gemmatimonadota bacterium]